MIEFDAFDKFPVYKCLLFCTNYPTFVETGECDISYYCMPSLQEVFGYIAAVVCVVIVSSVIQGSHFNICFQNVHLPW